jgi:hypothetical protein
MSRPTPYTDSPHGITSQSQAAESRSSISTDPSLDVSPPYFLHNISADNVTPRRDERFVERFEPYAARRFPAGVYDSFDSYAALPFPAGVSRDSAPISAAPAWLSWTVKAWIALLVVWLVDALIVLVPKHGSQMSWAVVLGSCLGFSMAVGTIVLLLKLLRKEGRQGRLLR